VSARKARERNGILRVAAEFARQVADRAGAAEGHAQQQRDFARRSGGISAPRSGLSATNVRTPYSSALRMSRSRLIGWVSMQRAGSTPSAAANCTSPVVARSSDPPSSTMVRTTAECGNGFNA